MHKKHDILFEKSIKPTKRNRKKCLCVDLNPRTQILSRFSQRLYHGYHQQVIILSYCRPRRSATQILWKGNCNFSGLFVLHNSRSFRLIWGCLIIKNEMSRYVQWIANWSISLCKHIQIKLSYPSINRALRILFIDHSGLLCIAVPIIRMMTLTFWKSENVFIEVVLV